MKNIHKELKQMNAQELVSKVEALRHELFSLRLNAVTTHVKSFSSQQKALKKAIACGLTYLQEKTTKNI